LLKGVSEMSDNEEPIVFRCGANWLGVVGLVLNWYFTTALIVLALLVALYSNLIGLGVAFRVPILLLATILACGAIQQIRGARRLIRNWRAEVTPEALRITNKDGHTREIVWDDVNALHVLISPWLHTAEGDVILPLGITDRRRLISLITEHASLTQRSPRWMVGVMFERAQAPPAARRQQ